MAFPITLETLEHVGELQLWPVLGNVGSGMRCCGVGFPHLV